MGAGQIGGIATLLDVEFDNAAGFVGEIPESNEGQYVVMFMSHAMMFCAGSLLEAHVVLTAAICVFGEQYKFDVVAGTHKFLENTGVIRQADHICLHRGFNYTSNKYQDCTADNIALVIINSPFEFHIRYKGSDFMLNRIRYGVTTAKNLYDDTSCRYYGWGSRRNGFLIPLLINIRKVKVAILPKEDCLQLFNTEDKYLCMRQHSCVSETYGALCPDDVGSVLECSGFARGIMISRLVDRPCGVGFVDLIHFQKFLTCGVDDSRDVMYHDFSQLLEMPSTPSTPELITFKAVSEIKMTVEADTKRQEVVEVETEAANSLSQLVKGLPSLPQTEVIEGEGDTEANIETTYPELQIMEDTTLFPQTDVIEGEGEVEAEIEATNPQLQVVQDSSLPLEIDGIEGEGEVEAEIQAINPQLQVVEDSPSTLQTDEFEGGGETEAEFDTAIPQLQLVQGLPSQTVGIQSDDKVEATTEVETEADTEIITEKKIETTTVTSTTTKKKVVSKPSSGGFFFGSMWNGVKNVAAKVYNHFTRPPGGWPSEQPYRINGIW